MIAAADRRPRAYHAERMALLRGPSLRAIGTIVVSLSLAACRAKSATEAPAIAIEDDIAAIESTLDRNEAELGAAGVQVALRELTPPPGVDAAASPPPEAAGEAREAPEAEETAPEELDEAPTSEPTAPTTTAQARPARRTRQSATDRCERIRELAVATCELKTRICDLASRHPDAIRYEDACLRAEDQCRAASAASTECGR